MKSPKNIEGRWWVPESTSPQFGILKLRANGTAKLVTRQPQSRTNAEIMMGVVEEQQPYLERHLIHGRDIHDAPITLFNVCKTGHSFSGGMIKRSFIVSPAVQGVQLASMDEKRFTALGFRICQLHEWLGVKVVTGIQLNEEEYAWKIPILQPEILYEIEDGVRFRIDIQFTPNGARESFEVRPSHRIWFHFSSPISLEDCLERWVPWTRNLFSLLIGRSVFCEDIGLYEKDPWIPGTPGNECKVLKPARRKIEEILGPWMIAPYPIVSDSLGRILAKWNETEKKLTPAIDLLCSVAFWGRLPQEAKFLFLVQAAEVFHGRKFNSAQCDRVEHTSRVNKVVDLLPEDSKSWVRQALLNANHKRLDERLRDLFDVCPRHSNKLFPEGDAITARIRYTRNHLTHFNGSVSSDKLIGFDEMHLVIRRLKSLLWLLLLNEIGCPETSLDRVITQIAGLEIS